jgi:hypothetical protein
MTHAEQLLAEYSRLAMTTDIPDPERHAQQWYILAAKMIGNVPQQFVDKCIEHWREYVQQANATQEAASLAQGGGST